MMTTNYTPQTATRLLPLLHSIATELREREAELSRLVSTLVALDSTHPERGREDFLIAETARQRRELRRIHHELDRLGCTLVKRKPVTIQIPLGKSRSGALRSLLWRLPVPRETRRPKRCTA